MAYKTRYNLKNPNKYIGKKTQLLCRSLWERRVCKFLDESTNVLKWSFEELYIPYINPIDKRVHNYIPDFLIQIQTPIKVKNLLVEVKPKKQVQLKESASKQEKTIFSINMAKWKAAKEFCTKHQMEFQILTEKELFHGN